MIPFAFFAARELDNGKVDAKLMMNYGKLFTVPHDDIFKSLKLSGLPRHLCIEPVDVYSQMILMEGLQNQPDKLFFIQHTKTKVSDKTAVEVLKDIFRIRKGQFNLVPYHDKMRECDLIRNDPRMQGFLMDLNLGKNCKFKFPPPVDGVVHAELSYTSMAGKDYNFIVPYSAVDTTSVFNIGDKVYIEFKGMKDHTNILFLEDIRRGFENLAELGTTVVAVAGDRRIRVKWGWLDKPKYRQANFDIFQTLTSQGVDIDTAVFDLDLTNKVSQTIGTLKGTGRIVIEDNTIYADYTW